MKQAIHLALIACLLVGACSESGNLKADDNSSAILEPELKVAADDLSTATNEDNSSTEDTAAITQASLASKVHELFGSQPPGGRSPEAVAFEASVVGVPFEGWSCASDDNFTGGSFTQIRCATIESGGTQINQVLQVTRERAGEISYVALGEPIVFSGSVHMISPSFSSPFAKMPDDVTVYLNVTEVSFPERNTLAGRDAETDIINGKLLGFTLGETYDGPMSLLTSAAYASKDYNLMVEPGMPEAQIVVANAPRDLGRIYFLLTPKSRQILKIGIVKDQYADLVGALPPDVSNAFVEELELQYGDPSNPRTDLPISGISTGVDPVGSVGKCSVVKQGVTQRDDASNGKGYLRILVACGDDPDLSKAESADIVLDSENGTYQFMLSMPEKHMRSGAGVRLSEIYRADVLGEN